MILDKETYLADGVAVGDAAVIGGTVVDLVKAPQFNVRPHGKIPLKITEAFVADGVTPGTAVQFDLVCADNAALSSNPVVVASISAVLAALTKDAVITTFDYPSYLPKRYFGIKATPTGKFTAGKFSAFVTMDAPFSYAVK